MVGITRAPSTSHGTGREIGAVVVDVGPDQHQALRHAERKAQTYGNIGMRRFVKLAVFQVLVTAKVNARSPYMSVAGSARYPRPSLGTGGASPTWFL